MRIFMPFLLPQPHRGTDQIYQYQTRARDGSRPAQDQPKAKSGPDHAVMPARQLTAGSVMRESTVVIKAAAVA